MFCVLVHPNNLVMWNCLTCCQLASLLGMYPRTLWRYDREGKIPTSAAMVSGSPRQQSSNG